MINTPSGNRNHNYHVYCRHAALLHHDGPKKKMIIRFVPVTRLEVQL